MIGKFVISPKIYLPVVYLLIAIIIYFILAKVVDKTLAFNKLTITKVQQKRKATIITLIKNVIKYIIAIMVILSTLSVYGVKTTSIIASLGIAGAIIGLAFQDIIKNLLAGITIIFDNHYMKGDVVTINGFKGEVIELGLQSTKIKAYNGEVMVIGNSLINSVINHSMYDTKLIIEIPVNKDVPLSKLESMLKNVSKKIEKLKEVKSEVVLLGIEKLNPNNYVYKVEMDCMPNNHYGVNREFMKLLKNEYEDNNIEVPGNFLEIKESRK
jgi:small conductance mechanosensitive channel